MVVYTPGNNTDFQDALKYYFGETNTLPGGTSANPSSVGRFSNGTRTNIGNWNISNVTNINDSFNAFAFATRAGFNQDISNWNTENVTSMRNVFTDQTSFNQDIGTWNTGSVTNMHSMFYGATSFSQNLSNWDVSNVTDVSQMFQGATSFNGDISSWSVANVTSFLQMFFSASSFNQDIKSWKTGNSTNFSRMFEFASSFNRNIRSWTVVPSAVLTRMFTGATSMINEYSSIGSFGTAPQYTPSYTFFNVGDNPSGSTTYGFGMPFKTQYMSQTPYTIGRSMFRRTTPFAQDTKQFKTQNKSRDSFGRVNALNTKAAKSSLTINGVVPNFKNVDPNFVRSRLSMLRSR